MRWLGVSTAALCCVLLCASAGAEQPRRVSLVIAGQPQDVAATEKAVGEPLSRLAVQTAIERAGSVNPADVIDPKPGAPPAFVRVWVDVSRPGRATIYFVDARWDRILVRHVPWTGALDEVAREEVAVIVRGGVEALLGGAQLGMTRQEARSELMPPARPKPRPKPPTTPPPRGAGVWLGGFYDAQLLRAGDVAQGPGLRASLMGNGPWRAGGGLTLQYRAPLVIKSESLDTRVQMIAVHAQAAIERDLGSVALGAGLGLGADLRYIDSDVASGYGGSVAAARWHTTPTARLLVRGGVKVGSEALLWLVLGMDADAYETRYRVNRDGVTREEFSLWRMRPWIGLEFSARLGPDR